MQSAEKKNLLPFSACLVIEDPMNGLLNPDDYEKGEESPARGLFPRLMESTLPKMTDWHFHSPTHDDLLQSAQHAVLAKSARVRFMK